MSTVNKGMTWHFSAPLGSHLRGVFETMIRAAKRTVSNIVGNVDITDEELHTAFTGAESLLNARPVTCQLTSKILCSLHQIISYLHRQAKSVKAEDYHPKKRWRRVQELVRLFWKRWIQEWLPSLSPRRKWKGQRDLNEGDIVLVISPDTSRGKWPLGRVLRVFPRRYSSS